MRYAFLALSIIAFAVRASGQSILTIVGGGTNDGRPATLAALDEPWAVAIDKGGNVYIADGASHRIRKIASSSGIISTIAGNGTGAFGGDGGPATSAQMFSPRDVVVDRDGNLLILDAGNGAVRKVNLNSGIITTIAGRGQSSEDNIPATNASFTFLRSLAADAIGNIYSADEVSIRQITANGLIKTVVRSPASGIAVDSSGRTLYYSDGFASIRKKDLVTGADSLFAGSGIPGFGGDNELATSASLSSPTRMAVDLSGNLYISDAGNKLIRRVDTRTNIITTFLSSIAVPVGLAFDAKNNLYVVDQSSNSVSTVSASGVLRRVAGTGERAFLGDGNVGTAAALNYPTSIARHVSGDLYIADTLHHRIRKWSNSTGIVSTIAGTGIPGFSGDGAPATAAQLDFPQGLALDSGRNELYVADTHNIVVRKVNLISGVITTVAGNHTAGDSGDNGAAISANFRSPSRVTLDASGITLYVLDEGSNRVRRVTSGVITAFAGGGTSSNDHVPATTAALGKPVSLAVDVQGNVYIADNTTGRVRLVDVQTGDISTVAGSGTPGFSGDGGPALNARVTPFGLAVDLSRNLYISDSPAPNSNGETVGSHRIRKVNVATGNITTVVGSGPINIPVGSYEGDDGPATSARLNNPQSVVVDAKGNLYIADTFSNRIRAVFACDPQVGSPTLTGPGDTATVSTSPTLRWDPVAGGFRYDVLLDTANPPLRAAVQDLTVSTFTLSNLSPATKYFWRVIAKSDPFCTPVTTGTSAIFSFTTEGACAVPAAFALTVPSSGATNVNSQVQLSWERVAAVASYDLYFGPSNLPPLLAVRLPAADYVVSGLAAGTTYFWYVVAHAACDVTKTSATAISSFTVGGGCTTAGAFALTSPSTGATSVPLTMTLQWSPSAGAASYDLFLGTTLQPPVYLSGLTRANVTVAGLLSSRTYFWRVVANVPCDLPKSVSTPIAAFATVGTCLPAGATTITFVPPGSISVGQTYVVAWKEVSDLDAESYYIVERSLDQAFATIVDRQETFSTSASFMTSLPGTYYHRVRPVRGCDPTRPGASSDVKSVVVINSKPNVIFTVQPQAIVTGLGDKLEDIRSRFTLENICGNTLQVIVGKGEINSVPFFTIVDPLGGDSVFVTLEPKKPKTFEIHFSGPANDRAGAYQGIIFVASTGQGLAITPYGFVNLKVGGGATSAPLFTSDGKPTEYAFFPSFSGDDVNRLPIRVFVRNDGDEQMELAAEIGPEVWLVPESGWNELPIAAHSSREIRLRSQRNRAPNGSALPRYTYFTIRSKNGQSARLLVQDNDALPTSIGRPSLLEPGSRSVIVPTVITDGTRFSKVRLTNVGSESLQADLYFTPTGSDGFDAAAVKKATIVIPPNDVVRLTDPLAQIFELSSPADGQIEIRAAPEKIGSLLVASSIVVPTIGGGAFSYEIPTLARGEGALIGSVHVLPGIRADADTRATLLLAETTGVQATRANLVLYDRTGARLGQTTIDVPRYGLQRIVDVVRALGGSEPFAAGRLEIVPQAGGGAVVGIVTILDATTGTGATAVSQPKSTGSAATSSYANIMRRRTGSSGSALPEVFVPVVVDGSTLGSGANYSTEMGFSTSGQKMVDAVVTYRDGTPGSAAIEKPLQLFPGISIVYDNVLEQLFGLSAGSRGSIFINGGSDAIIFARLLSFVPSAGRWSVTGSLPIIPTLSDALSTINSRRPLYLDGLEQSIDPKKGTDWTVIIDEIGGNSGSVKVQLYEAGNRSLPIGEKTFPISPFEQLTLNTVFSSLGLATEVRQKDRTNVLCIASVTAGGAQISVAGAVLDHQTGDLRHFIFSPNGGTLATGVLRLSIVTPVPTSGRRRAVKP